jgi:hypothetical protein
MKVEHFKFSYCYVLKWEWKYKVKYLVRDFESVEHVVTKCLEKTEDRQTFCK